MTDALYTLTEEEKIRLASHEEVIDDGLNTFHKVGMALLDIRDNRLYRQDYRTFEHYCEARWGMSRPRAYQLMDAAKVIENLSTPVDIPERHIRPLVSLEPEQQTLVWQVVEKTAPNGKVTGDHVKSVVNVMKDVLQTDAIDNGEGVDIPIEQASVDHLKAAIVEETYERMKRQELHIEEKMARKNGSDPLMSSNSKEWYTPLHIISLAQQVLGEINLDPATTDEANTVIQAKHIFTPETNGLEREWRASTLWLNPPYGDVIEQWVEKLIHEYRQGHFKTGIALLPARTDTAWWQLIRDYPRCFIIGRISFWLPGGETKYGAPFPSAAVYFGQDVPLFSDVFSAVGDTFVRVTL